MEIVWMMTWTTTTRSLDDWRKKLQDKSSSWPTTMKRDGCNTCNLIMLCLDRSNESDQLLPLWELSYAETHSTSCFPVTNSQLITTARSTNDEWLKLSKRWSWFKCTHWCIRLDSLGNAPSAGPSAIFFKHTLPVVTASHLDKTLVVALHSNWLLWHQACQLKATRWNPLKTNSFRIKNSAWDTDQTIPT